MRKKVTLITGAAGEVGQALVKSLASRSDEQLITLDVEQAPPDLAHLSTHIQGDILDESLFSRLISEYEFTSIYHLAALLSTRAEFTPEAAHRVNVEGTMGLLKIATEQSEWRNDPVLFIFPSFIIDMSNDEIYHKMSELFAKLKDAQVRSFFVITDEVWSRIKNIGINSLVDYEINFKKDS